jgi:tetratricopeptide (TPR) repeat protein
MAIEKMAVDAKNYALKAEVLRVTQGDFRETSAAYEHALKLNPGMLRLRYDYAKYLLAYRQYPKALAILWAGWDRLNIGAYQNGVAFLSFHLAVNQKIGKPQDNALIAQEIQRLLALKRSSSQGLYVLHHSSP